MAELAENWRDQVLAELNEEDERYARYRPRNHNDVPQSDIQRVFDRLGPDTDRYTDWRKCVAEPWASLAREMR